MRTETSAPRSLLRGSFGVGVRLISVAAAMHVSRGYCRVMGCGLPVMRLRREKLLKEAVRALGSETEARAWLKTEQPALGGVPDELVHELAEFQRVLAELQAMLTPT
jgi:hypothetical protein